ncbi:MAG: nucleotidyltransferase domain-containing protein [Candidatus Asgardarchaeum sp.]
MTLNEAVEKIKKALEQNQNVIFAYLYGSVATGKTHKFSDIDIAVYLQDYTADNFLKILASLPTDIPYEIDVRVLNMVPPLLRYSIIKNGRLLFTRNSRMTKDFVYRTLVEALEIKEDIERIRKAKLERFLNAYE